MVSLADSPGNESIAVSKEQMREYLLSPPESEVAS